MPPETMSDEFTSHLIRELQALRQVLATVQETQVKLQVDMAGMRAELNSKPTCPSPGDCTRLREEVVAVKELTEAVRADVDAHKIIIAKVEGGWKTLGVLFVASNALSGFAVWAFSHFSK